MSAADIAVWIATALDLGLRVTAPFSLTDGSGRHFEFDALFHEFGSEKGMLLFARWDPAAAAAATAEGFGYSCISADTYGREGMIDVLRDWGWSGTPHSRPPWCTPLDDEAG